jgi:homopolymeric O-antigen transport system ATP-binding protein
VGDARFQRKCIDKMQDVGQRGCTVLFVSHNMPAVARLCERAVLLDAGRVTQDGSAHQVVSAYLSSDHGLTSVREWKDPATAPATDVVRLCAIRVKTEDGRTVRDTVDIRQPMGVEIEYEVLNAGYILQVMFGIRNSESDEVLDGLDQDPEWRGRPRPQGRYVSTAWIPGNFLAEGMLFIEPFIRPIDTSTQYCYAKYAVAIQVVDYPNADTARGDYPDRLSGGVRPLLKWTTERRSVASGTPELGAKETACV